MSDTRTIFIPANKPKPCNVGSEIIDDDGTKLEVRFIDRYKSYWRIVCIIKPVGQPMSNPTK